jgi:hypothetical protein
MTAVTRLRFPEDRLSFVYGPPGEPIRTPPRTAIKIFADEACIHPADIRSTSGADVPFSTIYTGDDGLLPEFLGPEPLVSTLWARVVGGTVDAYPLVAQYSEQLRQIPTLTSGDGPPPADLGVPGGHYIDRGLEPDPNIPDHPTLYGPKTFTGWPTIGTPLVGPQGDPGSTFTWLQNAPSDEWVITYPMPYEPNVTTVDSSGTQIMGDVSYPLPGRIIVRWGAPESGRALLT